MSSEKDGTNLIAADNRRLFCLSVFTSTSVSTTSIPCDLNSYFFTFSRSSAASFSFPKSSFALLSLSSVSIFSPFFCFSLSCQFSQSLLLFLFLLSALSFLLLLFSVLSFLPSPPQAATTIYAVHIPCPAPLFLFMRHFQLERPA